MSVVPASMAFAIIQIFIMMILVRIIGTAEYSIYSLQFTFAIMISSLVSEWVRLSISRHSGSNLFYVRESMLRTALVYIYASSLFVLLISVFMHYLLRSFGYNSAAKSSIYVGMLCCSSIIGDCTLTFIRFNCDRKTYFMYTSLRISLSGALMIGSALVFRTATASSFSFAIGVLITAAIFTYFYWIPLPGRISFRHLLHFLPSGWAMAAGTIGTNATMALARLILQNAVPARAAGSILVALDLSSRGLNVLGNAFNTWSTKILYDAAHRDSGAAVDRAATDVGWLFAAAWCSIGVCGAVVSFFTPIILTGRGAYGAFAWASAANIIAILMLMARIFNIDTIMNAKNNYRAVVYASVAAAIGVTATYFIPRIAIWCLPVGVTLSYCVAFALDRGSSVGRAQIAKMLAVAAFAVLVLFWAQRFTAGPNWGNTLTGIGLGALDAVAVGLIALRWRRSALASS